MRLPVDPKVLLRYAESGGLNRTLLSMVYPVGAAPAASVNSSRFALPGIAIDQEMLVIRVAAMSVLVLTV